MPEKLAAYQRRFYGAAGDAWVAGLPAMVRGYLDRWSLTPDGAVMHGMVALVLPVRRADGTPAALKLQPKDPEHPGEPSALRVWAGDGAVRLLAVDPDDDTMLLERLDGSRTLRDEPDEMTAVHTIALLLKRLHQRTAPADIRSLREVAERMLADTPAAAAVFADPAHGGTLRAWAARMADVVAEPADRLLHWDLHYGNVLGGVREPWIAIDPKPLAGDPGFDLLPALDNRFDDITDAASPAAAVRRRFDALVDVLDLDRDRALAWTAGRLLQNGIWNAEEGEPGLHPAQLLIGDALFGS